MNSDREQVTVEVPRSVQEGMEVDMGRIGNVPVNAQFLTALCLSLYPSDLVSDGVQDPRPKPKMGVSESTVHG